MKIYVFEYLDQVSDSYHSSGGAVIVARDLRHAKKLVADTPYLEIYENDWKNAMVYELASNVEPRVFIFPDAGCC